MARIKVNSSELESAYRHSKTLVSKCEDVGSMVRSVINGMDDSSFSAKAGIMSDLHGISTRLNKQTELMRQYGAIIRAIENEMQAADSSFGAGSNSIWGNVKSWVGSTVKKILPFSTSSAFGKQGAVVSAFIGGTAVTGSVGIGMALAVWVNKVFGHGSGQTAPKIAGAANSTNAHNTTIYNGTTYKNVDYSRKILNQLDYEIVNEYGQNVGCTWTAWCMGLSMITGKQYSPLSDELGSNGCNWKGNDGYVWFCENGLSGMLQEAYDQIQVGKPSLIFGTIPAGTHAVTVVGIRSGADRNNLTESDFLVADPDKGVIKSLADLGYTAYERLIKYKNAENLQYIKTSDACGLR